MRDGYGFRQMAQAGIEVRRAVDVGAFVGASIMLIKDTWPAAEILAFEPWPESFALLVRNVGGIPGVTVCGKAVLADAGEAHMSNKAPATNVGGALIDAEGGTVPVGVVEVERIFDMGRPIDLLKLDCEGSEYFILEALAKRKLLQFVRYIRGEWHGANHGGRRSRIITMLGVTHKVQFSAQAMRAMGKFEATLKSEVL